MIREILPEEKTPGKRSFQALMIEHEYKGMKEEHREKISLLWEVPQQSIPSI